MDGASDGLNGNDTNGNDINGSGVERLEVSVAPLTSGTVWEPVVFIERICANASAGTEAERREKTKPKAEWRILFLRINSSGGDY